MTDWGSPKLKALVELGGIGAVLLGLFFVGLELRQNTAAVQAATSQGLTEFSVSYSRRHRRFVQRGRSIATSSIRNLSDTWKKTSYREASRRPLLAAMGRIRNTDLQATIGVR
jgi:hypothetical protein